LPAAACGKIETRDDIELKEGDRLQSVTQKTLDAHLEPTAREPDQTGHVLVAEPQSTRG
jgi:hypothetical protein